MALSSGNNPVLRMETYLAVTSNTIQFGAHAQLSASAGPVSVEGSLSFDVLLHLDPFGLQADFAAAVAFRVAGQTLLGVSLEGRITGPAPWHIIARASVTLLFVTVSIRIDATIGAAAPLKAPDPVSVLDAVVDALQQPAGWSAVAPAGDDIVTLLARPSNGQVRAHPLSTLTARKVAPLGIHLDKFGSATIAGPHSINVVAVAVGDAGAAAHTTPANGEFAPAQFRNLSDAQALSQPAFATGQAGITLTTAPDLDDLAAHDPALLDYTITVRDPLGASAPPADAPAPPDARSAASSPAACSPRRTTGAQAWSTTHRYAVGINPRARFTTDALEVVR